MTISVLRGDCLDVLREIPEASVHCAVTDPPYELGFMGRRWDQTGVAFRPETWRAVYDVLKPGAHLVAFGGTRTFHRMACAIEDAGFEIRDTLCWLYGQGFPKSLDVSKAIDKAAGAEREVIGPGTRHNSKRCAVAHGDTERLAGGVPDITAPATPDAAAWAGWGTALKPAYEPIILARKPLQGTVVANVLAHGTGAINVDACRVGVREKPKITDPKRTSNTYGAIDSPGGKLLPDARWPANVCHDGSDEVEAAFSAFGDAPGQQGASNDAQRSRLNVYGATSDNGKQYEPRGDTGSASRFFKACEYTDSELLICRAKAILAAWNHDLASTADEASCLPREAVVSALSCAVTLASHGAVALIPSSFLAPSTSATPNELRRISESAIAAILSIGNTSSLGSPRENDFPNGCHVKCAAQTRQTGTTTITISRWKSDGSAAPVTFSTMQVNAAPGEAVSANRFHYCAKADRGDRADSRHPTVKPVELMRWLVRLVTPPGGTVLDPFAGSGTTGEAAMLEGFDALLIERDSEHVRDIRHRIARWSGSDLPLLAQCQPDLPRSGLNGDVTLPTNGKQIVDGARLGNAPRDDVMNIEQLSFASEV